jgi:coenzyme PQQ precursor peptide PqqA
VITNANEVRHYAGQGGAMLFKHGENKMQWTTPSYTDMRFGFEITMYIATR